MSDHFRSLTPSALPFPGWSGAGRPTGRSRRGPKPGLRLLALLCLSSVFGGCGPGGAPASVEERAARLFDEGRVEQARRILEAELAENPTHTPAHLQLARILLAEGSADGAEAHLRTATESAPESVEVWTALGIFLLGGRAHRGRGHGPRARDPTGRDLPDRADHLRPGARGGGLHRGRADPL